LRYNAILVVSALASGLSLITLWGLFAKRLPCIEMTGFTLAVDCFLFVVGLGVANILYYLGFLAEILCRPRDVMRFRSVLFLLGGGFSVFLIFIPVLGNALAAATYPASTEWCSRYES
jgi:hypothetical protein